MENLEMLPSRQQIEERLSLLGYEAWPHFYAQVHGWFVIYENKELKSSLRLHYVDLIEANLYPPKYILSFLVDNETFVMTHKGIETLRIQEENDLNKISEFIGEYHIFLGYKNPYAYQNTKYEPSSRPYIWDLEDALRPYVDRIKNEKDWAAWRKKVPQILFENGVLAIRKTRRPPIVEQSNERKEDNSK